MILWALNLHIQIALFLWKHTKKCGWSLLFLKLHFVSRKTIYEPLLYNLPQCFFIFRWIKIGLTFEVIY